MSQQITFELASLPEKDWTYIPTTEMHPADAVRMAQDAFVRKCLEAIVVTKVENT